MNEHYDVPTSATTSAHVTVLWHKPEGRARRFDRLQRGLARRLRLWVVRQTIWERDHPNHDVGRQAPEYGLPWTSNHALANFSFACTCHKRERYSRKRRTR